MSKKQKENLTGFSWHIGYLKMDDFDERRDKRRCVHYIDESKEKKKDKYCTDIKVNYCRIANEHCKGSSHCSDYREVGEKSDKQEYKGEQFLVSIPCTIPIGEEIMTNAGKPGVLVAFRNNMLILSVAGKEIKYYYPQAFQKGHLISNSKLEKYIKNDLLKAVWK